MSHTKFVASLLVGIMMVAALAGVVSGAEEEDTCAVLFDFGNGRVMWADVPVTEGMNAFNATVEAAEDLGINIDAPNGLVSNIDGYASAWPEETWNFWIWNSMDLKWDIAMVGAADILVGKNYAIAWSYAAYRDPNQFIPPYPPIASPEHRYPWTSFRYDSLNTGLQETANISNPILSWSENLGNGAIDTAIIGANGLIYATTGGKMNWTSGGYDSNSSLYCLDTSGKKVWSQDIGKGYQVATPLLYADMVIAPSADGKLYAFDAADGTTRWTSDICSGVITGITSSPVAYLNKIIIAAGNGQLYSIHASNGTQDWNVEVATKIYSSSPAVCNGVVYIGDEDGNVSAFAADGSGDIWSTNVSGMVRASPLLDTANNQIVVTSTGANGNITALNMTTGDTIWQTAIGGSSASVAMASSGYVATTATHIIMVDFNGEELWKYPLGKTIGGAAPTVVGDTIFAVTNEEASRVVAMGLDGKLLWEEALEPASYALSAPTVIDGVLYVVSDEGYIYAYSSGTETVEEEFPWLLVGGIIALVIVAAVGLVYWNSKKKGM